MKMRAIEVDIDVHKALESRRSSFDQTPNQILREVFGLSAPAVPKGPRPSRSSGSARFTAYVGDKVITEGSMKLAYKRAVAAIMKLEPGFARRIADLETPGRRLIAKNPKDLYKNTPSLIEFAEPLDGGWWIDTNLSKQQAISRLMMICRVTGLDFGRDVRAAF